MIFKQFKPRENSKTQQKKREAAKEPDFIKCKVCGTKNETLYNIHGEYYCDTHILHEVKNLVRAGIEV